MCDLCVLCECIWDTTVSRRWSVRLDFLSRCVSANECKCPFPIQRLGSWWRGRAGGVRSPGNLTLRADRWAGRGRRGRPHCPLGSTMPMPGPLTSLLCPPCSPPCSPLADPRSHPSPRMEGDQNRREAVGTGGCHVWPRPHRPCCRLRAGLCAEPGDVVAVLSGGG